MRWFGTFVAGLGLIAGLPIAAASDPAPCDLVVVEATPGGIAMAVRAAREGLQVTLVNHGPHLGGILTSGLGVWDTQWEGKRSPIYDQTRQALFDFYRDTYGPQSEQYHDALPGKSGHTNGKFEPQVVEAVLSGLVKAEPNITVLLGYRPVQVERDEALISAVVFETPDGQQVRLAARIFADCSYEGDLLPLAKVAYRVGRESRAEFRELHAGEIFMRAVNQAPTPEAADEAAEKLGLNLRRFTGFQEILPQSSGRGDGVVQAPNYRTILSSDPDNQIPVTTPAHYDPELVRRLDPGSIVSPIPNHKLCWNRPQLLGPQSRYVEGNPEVRKQILDDYWNATLAKLYFLRTDASVPEVTRTFWRKWAIAADEFTDNGHRPYEMYIREGRRLVGRRIFTEHDARRAPGARRAPVQADGIAMTEWYMDTHGCTQQHVPGAMEEGKIMLTLETFPSQVPYRCLLPVGVDNLLVPVALSATHVAWGTMRLEPTWMEIGEAAGFAAALAVAKGVPVAAIDSERLQRTLAAKHVMLCFFNDVDVASGGPEAAAAEYFGAKGFFSDYDARLDAPLTRAVAARWADAFAQLERGALDGNALERDLARVGASAEAVTPATTRGAELLRYWRRLGSRN